MKDVWKECFDGENTKENFVDCAKNNFTKLFANDASLYSCLKSKKDSAV